MKNTISIVCGAQKDMDDAPLKADYTNNKPGIGFFFFSSLYVAGEKTQVLRYVAPAAASSSSTAAASVCLRLISMLSSTV